MWQYHDFELRDQTGVKSETETQKYGFSITPHRLVVIES